MSVSGEVGTAARRTREEWIGRRESSWAAIRLPGRGAVNVKDWRGRGVETLAASQPEACFRNRYAFQRPDDAEQNGQLMRTPRVKQHDIHRMLMFPDSQHVTSVTGCKA